MARREKERPVREEVFRFVTVGEERSNIALTLPRQTAKNTDDGEVGGKKIDHSIRGGDRRDWKRRRSSRDSPKTPSR